MGAVAESYSGRELIKTSKGAIMYLLRAELLTLSGITFRDLCKKALFTRGLGIMQSSLLEFHGASSKCPTLPPKPY